MSEIVVVYPDQNYDGGWLEVRSEHGTLEVFGRGADDAYIRMTIQGARAFAETLRLMADHAEMDLVRGKPSDAP